MRKHYSELDRIIAQETQIINDDCYFIDTNKAIAKVSEWLETLDTDILVDMLNNANTKDYYLAKLKNKMENK